MVEEDYGFMKPKQTSLVTRKVLILGKAEE